MVEGKGRKGKGRDAIFPLGGCWRGAWWWKRMVGDVGRKEEGVGEAAEG